MKSSIFVALALTGSLAVGCAADGHDTDDGSAADPFTSASATLLDLDFDGELVTSQATSLSTQVKSQLFYSVGQLNANSSVSRLAKLTLTNVTSSAIGGGLYRVKYHAKLPVAWGSRTNLPSTLALTLPKRVDATGIAAFAKKYIAPCGEHDGHDVTSGNFWYHFRPAQAGCSFADADVLRVTATAKKAASNTSGKYPEYHRVWEDGTLDVVAIFGKYASGATGSDDAGIAAYDAFLASARAQFPGAATTPAALPAGPGVAAPQVTIEAALPGDRTVVITALLVDELSSASAAFDKRFAELTPAADLVVYAGHAGLGANARALANKGAWFPGKYQVLFVDGCDTFAYQDDTLAKTRALLNPDDPTGTRHLDVITNAMPAYFMSMPGAAMSLIGALSRPESPKTYEQIFASVDPSQVVVADGEQDNVFVPGTPIAAPVFETSGTVTYKQSVAYTTETLQPGRYAFEMSNDPSAPGGDADLRVRAGAAPDGTQTYKCPSYRYNSNERCTLTITAPTKVFVTATGDSQAQASYLVRAFKL